MLLKMLNIIYVKKEKTYINSKFTMNAINLHGGHQIRFSRKYKRIPCQDPPSPFKKKIYVQGLYVIIFL